MTSWPSWPNSVTMRRFTSNPRWSLPIAIFMAVPAQLAPRALANDFRRQGVQAAPDLLGALPVDLLLAADRVADVVAGRRQQPGAGAGPGRARRQAQQVAASHGHQVVGL